MGSRIIRKIIVWVVVFAFFNGVTTAFSGARIMPASSVKVYKEEKLVQILKQESAFPNDALLITEGKCGVRSENFYLAADDGCTFSITDGLDQKNIRVDNGVVYFAINQKTGNVAFITPAGDISVQQIRSNAGINGGIVKGYLDVSGKKVQLGVLEGGSMVVVTDSGVQVIRVGKQLALAMADPIKKEDKEGEDANTAGDAKTFEKGKEASAAETETNAKVGETTATGGEISGTIPAAYYIGGSLLAGAVVFGVAANQGGKDDSPEPTSPASP